MARYFPVRVVKTVTETVVVTPGGQVQDERLSYDLPEFHPVPFDTTGFTVGVAETSPTPVEDSILGVLLDALEAHPVPFDSASFEATVDESHPVPFDSVDLGPTINESHPVPLESTIIDVLLDALETHPVPVEDVSGTQAQFQVDETSPVPTHTTDLGVEVVEAHPVPFDQITFETTFNESHPVPVEDTSGIEAVFVVNETSPVPLPEITLGPTVDENYPKPFDTAEVVIDVSWLWPDVTVSNTNWTNPALMIDKATGTYASCASTSTGGAGTGGTAVNKSCDMIVSAPDMNLGDLTITAATLDWSISATQSGVPLSAGQCNINYQYSLNDGASWTTFFAQTGLNGSVSSLALGGSAPEGVVAIASQSGKISNPPDLNVLIPLPAGTVNGDLLLVYFQSDQQPMAAQAGWTSLGATGFTSTFWKIANNEPATLSFTRNSTENIVANALRVTGHDPSGPIVASGQVVSTGGLTSLVLPSVTAGANNGLIQVLSDFGVTSFTPPAGTTEVYDNTIPGTGSTVAGGIQTVGAGATGTRTWTLSGSRTFTAGAIFAVKPSPASGAGATAAQLNQLRLRAVGTVASGTGTLPVTTEARWFFTRCRILANKTY